MKTVATSNLILAVVSEQQFHICGFQNPFCRERTSLIGVVLTFLDDTFIIAQIDDPSKKAPLNHAVITSMEHCPHWHSKGIVLCCNQPSLAKLFLSQDNQRLFDNKISHLHGQSNQSWNNCINNNLENNSSMTTENPKPPSEVENFGRPASL